MIGLTQIKNSFLLPTLLTQWNNRNSIQSHRNADLTVWVYLIFLKFDIEVTHCCIVTNNLFFGAFECDSAALRMLCS